jgi:hypothetical protein
MQTQQSSGKALSFLLTAFIATAGLAAILFNQLTLQAMEFHARDYTYYLQFAAKLLHDRLTPHHSLNPEGFNFLGFHGIDGEAGLHQAIHIEPIKYLDALVYALFRTPTALIVWRSLLFFAPLLYFLRVFPTPTPSDRRFAALFVLLYCLYPAVPAAAVYDLRPFGLLAPAFLAATIAITLRRPTWETALAFNALFLAREEALVLGPLLIFYRIASNRSREEPPLRGIGPLAASWAAWTVVAAVYWSWAGYERTTTSAADLLPHLLAAPRAWIALGVLWAGGGLLLIWLLIRSFRRRADDLPALAFLVLLLPLWREFLWHKRDQDLQGMIAAFLYDPRWMLLVYGLLLVALIRWQTGISARGRRALLGGLAALLPLVIGLHFASGDAAFWEVRDHLAKIPQTALIFEFRRQLDPTRTHILCDYTTHQAFYDFEYLYVYERLPAYLIPSQERLYPANIETLTRLLREEIEYIMISRQEQTTIDDLITRAGIAARVQPLAANDRYIILVVARPSTQQAVE